MPGSANPEQPPSEALSASESASGGASGTQRGSGADPGPQTGAQSRGTQGLTEADRDDLIDLLPKDMILWPDDEELSWFPNRTYDEWRDTLGHPKAHTACCKTCGCAITCTLGAFYDSVISSVVRELARLGALRKPGPAEHCIHDRAVCDQHHRTPVPGCPFPRCSGETGTGTDDVPTGGLT